MVLKLYKLDASPPARAVMMVCDLLNIPAVFVECNLFANDHFKEDFLHKNPLHTVPILEDGDLIIHDSHAIIIYLAEVYGKNQQIYPKDVKQRTLIDQKLFFDNSTLFPRLRSFTFPFFFKNVKNMTETTGKDIEEAYSFTEKFLSKSKFLALDHITLADISAYATLSSMDVLIKVESSKYPKLAAWMAEMESQPYAKKYNVPGIQVLIEAYKTLGAVPYKST